MTIGIFPWVPDGNFSLAYELECFCVDEWWLMSIDFFKFVFCCASVIFTIQFQLKYNHALVNALNVVFMRNFQRHPLFNARIKSALNEKVYSFYYFMVLMTFSIVFWLYCLTLVVEMAGGYGCVCNWWRRECWPLHGLWFNTR